MSTAPHSALHQPPPVTTQRGSTCSVRPRPTTTRRHAGPPQWAALPAAASPLPAAGAAWAATASGPRTPPHVLPARGTKGRAAATWGTPREPPPRGKCRPRAAPSSRPPRRRPTGRLSDPRPRRPPHRAPWPRRAQGSRGRKRDGVRARGPGPLPKRKVCGRSGPMLSMSMALSSIFSACSRWRSCKRCGAAGGRALKEAPRPPPPRYSPRVLARSSGLPRPR